MGSTLCAMNRLGEGACCSEGRLVLASIVMVPENKVAWTCGDFVVPKSTVCESCVSVKGL